MIDLTELAQAIQNMTHKQQFYKVLKRELKAKGHWKELPRFKGNASHFIGKLDDYSGMVTKKKK